MRYICAQPAILYYAWQIDVMIASFIKNGVNPSFIDIILADQINNSSYYNVLKKNILLLTFIIILTQE